MIYELKNCRNGEAAPYATTVEITEQNGRLRFFFRAEHSSYYCPYKGYNKIHSEGDACEVLIGNDPERKTYFEMEISAKGDLMLARMVNHGFEQSGDPILELHFEDVPFIEGKVEHFDGGYTACISFEKSAVCTHGDAPVYFNAYRLETDGGEMDKHLFALNPTMYPKFHHPECFIDLEKSL